MTRRAARAALLGMCVIVVGARGAAARNVFGDTVEAARLLSEWRYDEARPAIARLAKRAPKSAETRYLEAEMAFVDGAYERVLERLEGVDDSVAEGSAGVLRQLAASTLAVTRDFIERQSSGGHFLFVYQPGQDEVLIDLADEVLETAYRVLGQDLGYQPSEPVRVEFLGRPADLARMSPLTEQEIETTGTIALCKYGKLMVVSPRATLFGYPWMDTLAHEYTHYVVARTSHNQVPIWLHEGLARFAQTRWRKPPGSELSAPEEQLLANALERNKLISFDDMHPSMAKLPSQEAAALAFAEVFTMVGYIHERAGFDGIRQVLALHKKGKSAKRAVAETLDETWPRIERAWKNHLRARKLDRSKNLSSRATRIRFDKGGAKGAGQAENVGVDDVASVKARKHARLGGMLRARGMSEAAAVEYEKALAAVGRPEPFLEAKLSRTYLELGRAEEAITMAEPLLLADEHDAAPAVTLGLAHMALGHLEAAREAFETALRVSPFDPAVRCSLAEIYTHSGDDVRRDRERAACRVLR
jgi:tetratricopeptide (TPR) repeat protein